LVSIIQVQQCLRLAFAKWGLPLRLRMDNGYPWGSRGDLPTELSLWLLGLAIEMIWNPPACPQKNGVVERSQGVGKNWAEPGTCRTVRELQQRLDKFDRLQRERYPAVGQQSRIEAFPDLMKTTRRYRQAKERAMWDWRLVTAHLQQYAVIRKVDDNGAVSLYNRQHYVGSVYAGKHIVVHYDAVQHEWEFYDTHGHILRRQSAPELDAQNIYGLSVLRHVKTRIPKSRQN
jgi:hypothetical protein